MKKHLFWALALLSSVVVACSEEDVNMEQEMLKEKVTFVIGEAQSRSVTTDDFKTKFVDGDRIGIFGTLGAEGNENVLHEVSGGKLQSDEGVYYTGIGGKQANFYAYFPYSEAATDNNIGFTIGADQSSDSLFNANDFMMAEVTGIPINSVDSIELNFKHGMVLVQLEVISSQFYVPTLVMLNGCRPSVTWQYKSGKIETSGDPIDIKMWNKGENTDGSIIYWALVPAQTIAAGESLLSFTVNEREYVFTTKADIPLTMGTIKKFKIGIGEDGSLVVFSTDITAETWNDDESAIEGEGTLVEPETLMATTTFDDFSFTAIEKTKEEIAKDDKSGWYLFNQFETDTLQIAKEGSNNVMHLKRALQGDATALAWHSGAFYYEATDVVKGKYSLKFKAKSSDLLDTTDKMAAHQLRIGAYMQTFDEEGKNTDYFAVIERNETEEVTCIYPQIITTNYAEYEIVFNLAKVSTIHNATAANVKEDSKSIPTGEMLKRVVLYISSNKPGCDFYIDDISWTPYQ